MVRYEPGQKYDLHTDFWPERQVLKDGTRFNRLASFFVFLRDECEGGETNFPLVEAEAVRGVKKEDEVDEKLEKWFKGKVARGEVDGVRQGVKFKPIQGNGIFWVNLNGEGREDWRVVHGGLPVVEGEKIGMNLWPRKFFGKVDG